MPSTVIPDTNAAIAARSSLFNLYIFREHYLLIEYDLVKMIYTFITSGVGFHNSQDLRIRQNSTFVYSAAILLSKKKGAEKTLS